MKARWESVIKRSRNILNVKLDPVPADAMYTFYIEPAYTKNRYYHTLNHIKVLLEAIKDFKLTPEERVKLELAIWFHDIVYDSKTFDNEFKSSEEFKEFASFVGMEPEVVPEISKLILVTKHTDKPKTKLEKIICDVDLKELASKWYIKNKKNVRKEYAFLSEDDWKKGRGNFLLSMLDKEHIYHTDEYRGTLEDTARTNLQLELDTIS